MKLFRHVLIGLTLFGLCATSTEAEQPRAALIIGNAAYQGIPLTNPVNDARDMAAALKQFGFEVTLLTDADRRSMIEAIQTFGDSVTDGSAALVYFSGHGLQSQGSNYLMPLGANIKKEADIEFETVDANRILAHLQEANGKGVNILILDACRDNPFKGFMKSAKSGLAQMDAPTGSLIVYATAPNTAALDDTEGSNSVYTRRLLDVLRDTPTLNVTDILMRVRKLVMQDTDSQQVPWEAGSLTDYFYFTEAAPTPEQPTATPSPTPTPTPTVTPSPTPTAIPSPTPTPKPDASIEQNMALFNEAISLIQTNYVEASKVQTPDLIGTAIEALETAVCKAKTPPEQQCMFTGKGLKAENIDDMTKALRIALPHSRLSSQELAYAAIIGVLKHLDEHSSFMPPELYQKSQVETHGNSGGLGIQIGIRDGQLLVIAPIHETPAFRAGIQAGDKILKIGEQSTDDMTLTEAVSWLRGAKGTSVTLTIMRDAFEQLREFTITRDIINIESVTSKALSKTIGYIRISQFQEDTPDDLAQALQRVKKQKIKMLILDLRDNPGGLLNAAVEVVDQFLPKGKLSVYTEGRRSNQNMRFVAKTDPADLQYPVLLLVNDGSASASEIVAGALQAHSRAIIIGTPTYGKGSIESVIPLSDGSGFRLATAYYFTPNGEPIHQKGITPDVLVIPKDKQDLVRTGEALRNKNKTPLILVDPDTEEESEEDRVLAIARQMIEKTSSYNRKNLLKTAEKMVE